MNAHVLVVEDDEALRTVLQEVLDSYDFRASGAANGLEALERVEEVRPDCIVLDLIMPELDGLGFLDAFRRVFPDQAELPILAMSASLPSTETRERLRRLGAPVILQKPFDIAAFVGCVLEITGAGQPPSAASR